MQKILLTALSILGVSIIYGQTTFPVNGVYDERSRTYAFTHATIVTDPGNTLQDATLLISDGRIIDVGTAVVIPKNAVVEDLHGKYIYPAFIDLDAGYGMPAKENPQVGRGPQMLNSNQQAVSWNQAITPEYQAVSGFKPQGDVAKLWRSSGFGLVLTHRHDGIMRGTGALVSLGDERAGEMVVKPNISDHYSFRKGTSTQEYPQSEMGSIALIRQTFYDADWYGRVGKNSEQNISLQAVLDQKNLIHFFDTDEKLEILRVAKIGKEFGYNFIMMGSGNEYQRINEIKQTGAVLVLPLNFPKTPDVSDPWDAELLSISDLKHWEMAPANPAITEQAGITFALTSSGLDDKSQFLPNVRKALQYGLSEKTALSALTSVPAQILKLESETGSLAKGKRADFFISSDNIFREGAIIYTNWVNGLPYVVNSENSDLRGAYALHIDNMVYGLLIQGKINAPEFSIIKNTDTLKAQGAISTENIQIQFADNGTLYRLTGYHDGKNIEGQGNANDKWINWKAEFASVYAEKPTPQKKDTVQIGTVMYPFTAYGWEAAPTQGNILITNATVWTSEKEGVLKNTDVLIGNGKILQVGKNISAKNARIIDGTGKHVTPGIIDEHSHIAVTDGVNEGTQNSSAEVRIADVINCDDINIYRQLSGGVTSAHILHGSANPVGGQTQLIKLRWGAAPEDMKFAQWPGFIKFALGENVKQSNWGDDYSVRFPQTRMGVEQVYVDIFTRASEYAKAKKENPQSVRTDLELEAIAEILEGKRFITCHSYVQSEINMLMHVADSFGFTINTFTHILEGYKVADKMKIHGAGASTFSDWWAYKFEVYEAIPQNPGIMHDAGLVTAINSDDAEMGRRLNQEAAKSVKYFNMSEPEALKMVTINPAKLLHVDDKVGSIKVGKDADIVIWSEDPLSVYAMAEKTIVDGKILYDRSIQDQLMAAEDAERHRIINKMMAEKTNGAITVPIVVTPHREYDCEDVIDFMKGE